MLLPLMSLMISMPESRSLVGEDVGVIMMLLSWAYRGDEAIGFSVKFSGSAKKLVNPFEHFLF